MMSIEYRLAGTLVTPTNHKELSIDVNFDKDSPDARVLTNKWIFDNEAAEVINNFIDAGLSNGVGIFEGIPFDITVADGTTSYTFNQYLDLSDPSTIIAYDHVEANAKDRGGIDWINTIADSFTFEYLHEKTSLIPSSKFVAMPYIINTVPNYRELFLVTISSIVIIQELKKAITDISAAIGAAGNPFSSISEFIRVSFLVVYIIALIITIIKLIKDILDLIIQPVKYHLGMYVKDMIEAACSYLGLKFSSTILTSSTWADLFIIPEKFENPPSTLDDRILGFILPDKTKQKGYYRGTFGDLLRAMKIMFKGKIILNNGVLQFERKDYNNSAATYQVPSVRVDEHSLNTDELVSNYLVEFLTDVSDKNTVQEYKGTIYQVITQPKQVINRDMVAVHGLDIQTIPFALAKRKETLTGVEKIVDSYLKVISATANGIIVVINAAIKLLNAVGKAINSIKKVLALIGIKINLKVPTINSIPPINLSGIINDRLGMMLLETDVISVQRIMLIKGSTVDRQTDVAAGNRATVNAKYLYDNFHFIDSFIPSTAKPNANQWERMRVGKAPFRFQDYVLVRNNNKVTAPTGEEAKLESLKWNVWEQTMQLEYRKNKLYTLNLIQTTHEGQGY